MTRTSDWRWYGAMAIVAVMHVALSLTVPQAGWVTSLGTGSMVLIAAACCLVIARSDRPRLWRWRLLATTFLLWAGAFASIAWTQSVLHSDSSGVLFDSLLFMARGAPLLLLLVYDPATRMGRFRRLDAVQAIVFVGIAAVLLFPGIVGRDGHGLAVRTTTGFSYREWMNIGISVVALLLWHVQPSPQERRFVGRVASLWLGYTLLAAILNRVSEVVAVQPGSPLWWPFDALFAGFVMLVLHDRAQPLRADGVAARDIGAEAMRRFAPSLFTATMLVMSAGIGLRTPIAGIAAGCAVMALYGVRSVLLQAHYVETLDQLETANDTMTRLIDRDQLTQRANRRTFDAALADAWVRLRDRNVAFGVMMIEIDQLNALISQAGRNAGDTCLRRAALALHLATGPTDLFARYDDGVFAVLTREADPRRLSLLAERLRIAMADEAIVHPATASGIATVSIGMAIAVSTHGDSSAQALIARAEDALARAKTKGRDRAETAAWPIVASMTSR